MNDLSPEVFEMIISHLSNEEIIKCSAICLRWMWICRNYLRKHRTIYATIKLPTTPIEQFDQTVAQSLHFVTGIKVINAPDPTGRNLRAVTRSRPIVKTNGLQYFEIHVSFDNCNANDQRFLRAMIVHNAPSLKQLSYTGKYSRKLRLLFDFLRGENKCAQYPVMKVINMNNGYCVGTNDDTLQQTVVPKLQKIGGLCFISPHRPYVNTCFKFVEEFLIGRLSPPIYLSDINMCLDGVENLKVLFFHCYYIHPFVLRHYSLPTVHLVGRNAATIKTMTICPCRFCICMTLFPRLQFTNTTTIVYINIHCRQVSRTIEFDMRTEYCSRRIFPALESVTVSMRQFFEYEDDDMDVDESLVALNFNRLTLHNYDDNRHFISAIGMSSKQITSMIVHVEHFGEQQKFLVSSCLTDCPNLENLELIVLTLTESSTDRKSVIDAFLCGMSIDEVKEIKKLTTLGGVNLDTYQYAPIRPCLQFSRPTHLIITDSNEFLHTAITHYVSEVSCRLAVARSPHVTVSIKIKGLIREDYPELGNYITIIRQPS